MVVVSDLDFSSALEFTYSLKDYELEEREVFDFSEVHNCDPFPMLIASTAIRQLRGTSSIKTCVATNCENSYARHMRFYKAIGINWGRELDENYGNCNYLPITKLSIKDLREDGIKNLERIQEVIVRKAKLMAAVLSQGDVSFKKWLTYVLTEIMRNIPEHSKANEIWYCAQYWPRYDLVELAILDEGIGVRNSLLSNYAYDELISDDRDALKLSLRPGISRTFAPGSENLSTDEWKNSGYGLYMVSRLCEELGGSFIIASGDSAIQIRNNKKRIMHYRCHIQGTGIQIRIKPSKIVNYERIAKDILREGEGEVKDSKNAFKSASKSTRSLFGYDD
ncbi:MAG: hypothetical protein K2M60_11155 [Lachnospiraceae bacterium]|nr:hypothetical protein [Lachnospiraceae bacterium]MDE6253984.1 hypothetical protein [Lachnospiraceae bacterium]